MKEQVEYLTKLQEEGDKLLLKALFHQSELSAAEVARFTSKAVETIAYYKEKEKGEY